MNSDSKKSATLDKKNSYVMFRQTRNLQGMRKFVFTVSEDKDNVYVYTRSCNIRNLLDLQYFSAAYLFGDHDFGRTRMYRDAYPDFFRGFAFVVRCGRDRDRSSVFAIPKGIAKKLENRPHLRLTCNDGTVLLGGRSGA